MALEAPSADDYGSAPLSPIAVVLISGFVDPIAVVSVDVTAFVQAALDEAGGAVALRLETILATDADALFDQWFFGAVDNVDPGVHPKLMLVTPEPRDDALVTALVCAVLLALRCRSERAVLPAPSVR